LDRPGKGPHRQSCSLPPRPPMTVRLPKRRKQRSAQIGHFAQGTSSGLLLGSRWRSARAVLFSLDCGNFQVPPTPQFCANLLSLKGIPVGRSLRFSAGRVASRGML
jgi:hypothetical protein